MAITLVGTAQVTDAGFSDTRNGVAIPAGIQADDVLFAVLVTANVHTIGTIPSGWSQLGTTQDTADPSVSVIYKICSGAESGTVDLGAIYGGSESGGTATFAMRGLDTADLVEALAQNALAATTTIASPSVTPVNNGCAILHIFGCDPDAGAPTFAAETTPACTKVIDSKTDTGDWSYVGAQFFEQATAAAVSLTADVTAANFPYGQFIVALNAASTSSTPGVTSKTLERAGVAVAAATAAVFIWNGHGVDLETAATIYKNTSVSLASGVLPQINLASSGIAVSANITIVVRPATGGPGIIIETTAEEIT